MTEFTIFMLLKTTPAWLRLDRGERGEIAADVMARAQAAGVALKFYDAEAFAGRASDVAVFTTTDLAAYHRLVDGLRGSALFATPYYEIVEILPTIENRLAA